MKPFMLVNLRHSAMSINSAAAPWKVVNFQVSSIPKRIFLSSRCYNYKSFNWRWEIFFNINNWKNQAYPSLISLLQSYFYRHILETLHCQIPSLFHHIVCNWFPQLQGGIFYHEKPRTEQKAWTQRSCCLPSNKIMVRNWTFLTKETSGSIGTLEEAIACTIIGHTITLLHTHTPPPSSLFFNSRTCNEIVFSIFPLQYLTLVHEMTLT